MIYKEIRRVVEVVCEMGCTARPAGSKRQPLFGWWRRQKQSGRVRRAGWERRYRMEGQRLEARQDARARRWVV